MINSFIYNDLKFDFHEQVRDAHQVILWESESDSKSEKLTDHFTISNYLLVGFKILLFAIRDMRDMYIKLFFISGIAPLWLVSFDYKQLIEKELDKSERSKFFLISNHNVKLHDPTRMSIQYQEVCNVTRAYNQGHGYALISFIVYALSYYSIRIDTFFRSDVRWGKKFYLFQFTCGLGAIYGLGAGFSFQVNFWNIF